MPELPEVESVRRGLEKYVAGRTFTSVEVLHPRAVRGQEEPLERVLAGRGVRGVARRGKFMWLELSDEDLADPAREVLFIHLGMSGQLRVGRTESKHVRLVARLAPDVAVSFVDQRTFGYWRLGRLTDLAHIAPDPLSEEFDADKVACRLRVKRTAVKTALLDQTLMSGIGNIYADEALWAARISPRRRASTLLKREALALIDVAITTLRAALAAGGTSFDSLYVNVNGESGYFARSLRAYGKQGQPCVRCGYPIERATIGGRSSHFCPKCQN